MYESIVVPTLLCGCEAWVVNVAAKRKLGVEVVEMLCEINVRCKCYAENL